jgi:lantibiotic modifying enzyme
VFFGYLAKAGVLNDAKALAWGFLEEAEEGVANHRMEPWLCEGFSGIAWAHAHLHQTLFGEPDRGALKDVDETLLALLRDWPWPERYELLYGLVGIGVYALERLPRRRARTMVRLVIEWLKKWAQSLDDGVAWRAPKEEDGPRGDYNLGMAHGVPGVIAFLARAAAARVEHRKALPLLAGAVRWLRAQRLPPEDGAGFPAITSMDGEKPEATRVAWCYGDPGVAAALLPAAWALDMPELEDEALALSVAVANRPREYTGVMDAAFCHGAGGVAHLYNRLFQVSGNPRLGAVARDWFAEALQFRRRGTGIAGFAPSTRRADGSDEARQDPGLLTGAAGIGLALLAAITPVTPHWDRMLLLDLNVPLARKLPQAALALQSR